MLSKQINASLDQWKQLREKDLAAFNDRVAKSGVPAISLPPEKKEDVHGK